MAHVTKHVMVLPHLGYVSSYDLYLFALCAELFDQDLPKSKFKLKFLLMKRPISANTKTEELYYSGRSLSVCGFINFTKFTLRAM